ncbi:MAG: Ig-like domain-containing protein [Cyclobacteriaceae bacterium]
MIRKFTRRSLIEKFIFLIMLFCVAEYATAQISTAADDTNVETYSMPTSDPRALAWTKNSTRLYIAGNSSIYEYTVGSTISASENFSSSEANFVLNVKTMGTETADRYDVDDITGLAFNGDGTYLYFVGEGGDDDDYINILYLPTAYDLSTARRSSIERRNIVGFTEPQDIQFNGDGTKAYVLAENTRKIYEFELTSPYSINSSTPSPGGSPNELLLSETNPTGFTFNANGSRLFVAGFGSDQIVEYYLPEPYEISTAEVETGFSLPGTQVEAIAINRYDSRLLVLDNTSNSLFQYSFNGYPTTSSVTTDGTNNPDKSDVRFRVTFSENVTGFGTRNMTIVKTGTVTYGNVTVSPQNPTSSSATSYYVDFSNVAGNGSLKIDIKEANSGGVKDYNGEKLSGGYTTGAVQAIGSPFNVLSATNSSTFDVNEIVTGATSNRDVKVSDDGTKLFVLDASVDKVLEFTLATPYDVSTATYDGDAEALSLTGIETTPSGMSFESGGSKLFVIGESVDGITEFNLGTPYDVSTATFVRSTDLSPAFSNNDGFDFSSDGMKVFVASETSIDVIVEYNLTAPYDISTIIASGVQYEINPYETGVKDLEIVHDGRFMIVVGISGEFIHTLEMTTPNDLSTATYLEDYALSTTDKEDNMYGIGFSKLGDWMYVIGSDEIVYSYSLNRAPSLLTFAVADDFNPSKSQATIDIEFSEPVSGLTSGGFDITGDHFEIERFGGVTGDLGILSGSQESYTLRIDNISGEGAIKVTINEDAEITDIMGSSFPGKSTAFMVGTAYNLELAEETADFDLDDEDTAPNGITFNDSGSKMYILGGTGEDVNVYDLSTPFDISTAVFKASETLVLSDISDPDKILFNPTGTKLFIRNNSNSTLHEYSVNTPFDVSTAQYAGLSESLNVSGNTAFGFNNDGTILFIGASNGEIVKYPLETAYDLSSNSVGGTEEIDLPISLFDFKFDDTGMRLFASTGSNPDRIQTYWMDAPYDVASAVLADDDLSLSFNYPIAFSFDNSGARIFIMDNNDFVKQYDLNRAPEVVSFGENENYPDGDFSYFLKFSEPVTGVDIGDFELEKSDGVSVAYLSLTGLSVIGNSVRGDGVAQVTLKETGTDIADGDGVPLVGGAESTVVVIGSAYDVSQASYLGAENSYTVTEETAPYSFTFNNDGSKMYVTGTSSDDLHEYNLSSPYDLTTVTFGQSFDLDISNPLEITFNDDGSKFFVLDVYEDIHEFSLSTQFDISSASYAGVDDSYVVYSQDSSPQGITFNADGTIMYMLGDSGNDINAYSLPIPYDISRASSLGSDFGFSVSTEETSPRDLQFSPDGKRLLVVGNSGLDINQYTLYTAWDVTTAIYLGDEYRLDLSGDLTSPGSMAFSSDGTKLFVLSTDTDIIHTYDLNAAPNYSTIEVVGTYPANTSSVQYKIVFTEMVTGFTQDDLVLEYDGLTGEIYTFYQEPSNPYLYTMAVGNLSGEGSLIVRGKSENTDIVDLVGKAIFDDYSSVPFSTDRVAPTATITIDDTALKIGDTPTLTITFSEEVEGFETTDLILVNGTVSALSTTDDIIFTATYTPDADFEETENIITIDMSELTDVAGNAGNVDVSTENFEIDTSRPTLTYTVYTIDSENDFEMGFFELVFNEPVNGLLLSNISVTNGTLSELNTNDGGQSYSVNFAAPSKAEFASNTLSTDLSLISDDAGNFGVGSVVSDNFVIDTKFPTVSVEVTDDVLSIGESTTVTYTFSEPVNVTPLDLSSFTTPNLTASNFNFTNGSTVLTFDVSPIPEIQDYTNAITSYIEFRDLIGNTSIMNPEHSPSDLTSENYVVDVVRPTVAVVLDDLSLITGESAEVTFTFTEAVSDFDNTDITIGNGTISDVETADEGLTFTATFTPSVGVEEVANIIVVDNSGYVDAVGNAGVGISESANFEINTVVPTLAISIDDTNLILDETATITFTFSEAVTGFDNDDITLPNGTLSAVSSQDEGITFTGVFTPTELLEDLENVLIVDNTAYTDFAGNPGVGISESENFTIDGVIPTVIVSMSDDGLIAGETSDVTFTFSELVVGFDNADITYEQGTLTDVTSEDGGLTFTALFTPTANFESNEDYFITVDQAGVEDVRGNAGSGTSSGPSYDLETLRPTVVITMEDTYLIAGETTIVTFAFSEKIGSPSEAISAENGIIDADPSSNDGLTYTAAFVPSDDFESLENLVSVDMSMLTDQAGNDGVGITSLSYSIDTREPTLAITMDDLYLLDGETTLVTFEFSEEVLDFTTDDIVTENGSISDLASTDNTLFTAVFTPDEELAVVGNVVSVQGSRYTDLASNPGVALSESEAFEINTVIPVITFEALVSKTYGNEPFALNATVTSEDEVVFSSSNPEVASIENNTVTILAAGSAIITASQPADENTNAAISVEQTLTVNQATLTVTAEDKAKIYGESNPELTFTYDGFVNSEDETVITEDAAATTTADETSSVGNYVIGVSGGSADNYAFVHIAGVLSIAQKELIASAEAKTKTYGDDNPELTIAYSGFENGDDAADITEPAIATTATIDSGVGVYPITLSDGSAVNYSIQLVDSELTVNPADLLISADNQLRAYGEENPKLTITYDGLVLDETEDDLDTEPTISTEATPTSDVGEYAITVSGAQDANYSITFEQGTLTIEKADQTIDFATVTEIDLLNESTINLVATASSGMEVVFSLIAGDGSVEGNVFTANASGTYTVEASQAGDENYNAASVSQTFNVTDSRKENQAITFSELSDKVYGDLPSSLSATASSSLDVTYSATGPVSLGGNEVTIIGAGDVTITATQNGDDTFNPAPSVSQSFVVAKAALAVTADDLSTTFDEAIPELSIGYAGFVGLDNSSDLDVLPTSATTATVGSDAGVYEITVSGGSDDNYEMTYVSGSLTIEKADQTIDFATVEEIDLLNENTVTLLATASTGLDVVFSLVSGSGSLDGNILTASASGTFVVEASQAGNENYNAVSISQSFNVNDSRKDDQSITFAELADKIYGDGPFSIAASASSDLAVMFAASGPVSLVGTEITILGAGKVTITATQAGDDTFNPAPSVAQSFVVAKASLTATAEDKTTTYGVEISDLTVDYAGFIGADAIVDIDELPTAATAATMGSDAGTYEITISGGSDDNYEFEFISGQLTIEKADQTITFSAIDDIDIATQTTVDLSAVAISELAIDFNLTSGDGSIDGAVLTVNNTGTFEVEASQAGNINYNAASAIQTFNVNDSGKTDQTVSFGELADKVYGDAPFDISATATSSLAVSFTATGPVSILDNEVTVTGAGEITITATQTGDDTFNPAPSVSQSFTVSKASLSATADDQTTTFGELIPELSISYAGFVGSDNSSDLNVLPMSATSAIAGSDAGTYEITVSGGSDDNYELSYVSGSLTIAKADQAITFAAIDDVDIINGSAVTLSAFSTSELDITYTLVQGDGSIAGDVLTVNGTGTYGVEASQAGNDNYNAAISVSQIFNVTDSQKTEQTITFESLEDKVYGDVFTLGAQASSGLSVSYSVASGPATLSGGEVSITGVGSITIVATQAGDDTFNPAAAVSQTFAAAKAPLTATADDQAITYGDDIPVLTITYQGFVAGESASDLDEEPLTSTTASSASDAGEYAITLTGGASVNYEIMLADGSLTINKAAATITISDLEFDVDGTAKMPTITTDPADLNFTVTYDGAPTAPSAAGSYEVIVTIDETNYVGSATATLLLNEVLATIQSLNIRTYPNPTTEYFRVEAAMDLQFEVYSISGVLELKSETNKQTDVSSLSEGVYLIRVLDAKGSVVKTQQLIKQ